MDKDNRDDSKPTMSKRFTRNDLDLNLYVAVLEELQETLEEDDPMAVDIQDELEKLYDIQANEEEAARGDA